MVVNAAERGLHEAVQLAALPRIGVRGWHALVVAHGSAGAALEVVEASPVERAEAAAFATVQCEAARRLGAVGLVAGAPEYPVTLDALKVADVPGITWSPPILWAIGDLALLARPAAALVGTRQASATGLEAARVLARAVAEAGGVVVSGLARGIDAEAHTAALGRTGGTVAVIGTGLDVAYPADHRGLQRRIAREGLVLTESWFGARAHGGAFPLRNRIIAALAQVTVVVEAPERSGALITAQVARDLGRDCAAVPGPFGVASARGSNRLLADGALLIADRDDLLALLGLTAPDDAPVAPTLSGAEAAIWAQLAAAPTPLDELVHRTGWAADQCLAAVTTLELRGLVRSSPSGGVMRA